MSDIHQEWRELREKNGNFINHLDGEMAKIEKKQVELKRVEQLQNLADTGAFAMQFVAPPPFNCCQNDRDILKALNKAQADRIKSLEDEFLACKEQQKVDQAIKKDLDEKLDKATADYRALWVKNEDLKHQLACAKAQCENTIENRRKISELSQEVINLREQQKIDLAIKKDLDEKLDKATADYKALWVENEEKINNAAKSYARLATERNNLAETISKMEKTIRDLDERNGTLRERLAQTNASLKRSAQEYSKLQSEAAYLRCAKDIQAKEIKRLHEIVNAPNGSCSAYTQQGMQSKIAKQATEIKRLTEENEKLHGSCNRMSANIDRLCDDLNDKNAELRDIRSALNQAAKDAEVSFNRGRIKGMEEIWYELKDCYDGRPIGENEKIFGCYTLGDIIMNLSPTWFMNKAMEYHEQKEKAEARDIQIGDEVEIFDQFDHSLSDTGIVTAIDFVMDENLLHFTVIGPKFESCFDETDIQAGNIRKTGQHFDSIPLDYLA